VTVTERRDPDLTYIIATKDENERMSAVALDRYDARAVYQALGLMLGPEPQVIYNGNDF
jgi:hypothetical protein